MQSRPEAQTRKTNQALNTPFQFQEYLLGMETCVRFSGHCKNVNERVSRLKLRFSGLSGPAGSECATMVVASFPPAPTSLLLVAYKFAGGPNALMSNEGRSGLWARASMILQNSIFVDTLSLIITVDSPTNLLYLLEKICRIWNLLLPELRGKIIRQVYEGNQLRLMPWHRYATKWQEI